MSMRTTDSFYQYGKHLPSLGEGDGSLKVDILAMPTMSTTCRGD
ncbi:hypothetical protein L917_18852, partial [Phytophthora nicotianae]